MKKSVKRLLVVIPTVVLLVAGGGYWYSNTHRPPNPLEQYKTVTVTRGDVSRTLTGEAKVRTTATTSVYLQMPQKVTRVHVEEGDWVTEGQLLVEYDISAETAQLQRSIDEARIYGQNAALNMENIARPAEGNDLISYEAAVLTAEKNIADAEAEIESLDYKISQQNLLVNNLEKISKAYRDAYEDGSLDRSDYDTARTNYRMAEVECDGLATQLDAKIIALESYQAQLGYAEQRLKNAQSPMSSASNAARYQIQQNLAGIQSLAVEQLQDDYAKYVEASVSPMDGYVEAVHVQEGATASASVAVLELATPKKSVVRLEASEFDVPNIRLGQTALITAEGIPDRVYHGTVSKIYARALEKDGSDTDENIVPVEITLTDADGALKVGFSVDVEILLEQQQNTVLLPLQALAHQEDQDYVYIVTADGLEHRSIQTGLFGDKAVEILGGIAPQEAVLLNYREGTQ